ncbi:MAG: MarR family winged helix-turn-helix transcriptional regulator [Pseudomonadota bacterium]
MNKVAEQINLDPSPSQVLQLKTLVTKLFRCCQDRAQYLSERFGLPDAELRCLMLFGAERYLSPKGIAREMGVAKSRVSKITEKLIQRKLIQRIADPEDSRGVLLSLTADGRRKWNEINGFLEELYGEILRQAPADQRTALLGYLGVLETSMAAVRDSLEQAACVATGRLG